MFKKKNKTHHLSIPNEPMSYPKWTFARVGNEYWLILDTLRMKLISERAFLSWGKPYVEATEKSLSGYAVWKKLGFAPGTIVRSMDGQDWFITGSQPLETERRLVATPDFYLVLGFDYKNAITVSQDELLFHKEGVAISGI
jgi:hypothetical protein